MTAHVDTPTLWHFTCSHAARAIGRRGVLRPHPQPALGGIELTWATDLHTPDRDGLGLTSLTLRCDRTGHRYRITEPHYFEPWLLSGARAELLVDRRAWRQVARLETDRRPDRWWVTTVPARAVLA